MTEEKMKSYGKGISSEEESSLTIRDLIQYLSRLANLHSNERTGNQELSNGLRKLARALRPYANQPVLDLNKILAEGRLSSSQTFLVKTKVSLPPNLESISCKDAEEILDDNSFSKSQLVDLGASRFSISRSKLVRLSRHEVLESIRAALDHERSLEVISQEARRIGARRTS